MTYDEIPEDLIEAAQRNVAASNENERRRAEMYARVLKMDGPLGELLRTIATNVAAWNQACEAGVTTDQESIRMERIADAALECTDWLLDGA
jgi:hypothetical protein